MHRFTAKFTTRKRFQDTIKVYNQETVPRYQSVQPGKGTKIPTKCTTRKKVPRYQQSVQPGNQGTNRCTTEKKSAKLRYQQSEHVVGILICISGSVNLAVNLHIVSSVQ